DQDFSFCREFFRQGLDERVALQQREAHHPPDLFSRISQKYDLLDPDERARLYTDILSVSLAGSDAPSLALAWTLYAIAANPSVEHRLVREIDEVLGRRMPTRADLAELPYTQAVVRESLRLYPPAWYTPRTNVEDDVLDGVRIPAGSTVIIFQYLMHHDPHFWPGPKRFRPERFLESRDHPAYMPYGWGPRYCFAADYAHAMLTAFTALIVRDYTLRLKTPEPPPMAPLINLRMQNDLHLDMKPRP
ncbi:MAG: cytochrome P450, partial [Acidobacteriota bacterium]